MTPSIAASPDDTIDGSSEATRVRALDYLRRMKLIRRFEERSAELYAAGEIRGFLHLYVGEEAVAVGVIDALEDEDSIVATYREHGHALARGIEPGRVMAELMGRRDGCSGGRGGSMHVFDAASRFYGGWAIVGGGLPIAAGLALAARMKNEPKVTACFFGEGAVAEGEFHEAMNLAALWRLPVLFCCENNGYAMGTALGRSESQTNLCVKAAAYEIPAWSVDGMDVFDVAETARKAVLSIRAGGGPVFLDLQTYRFRAHSSFDPELYRDKAEVEAWKEKGPVRRLVDRMHGAEGFGAESLRALDEDVERKIDQAIDFATRSEFEGVESLARFVVSDREASA